MKSINPIYVVAAVLLMTLGSCQRHFISDEQVREAVHEKFEARRELFTSGKVFSRFDGYLSRQEREAMEFLYASMTSADLGDYDAEYFLDNVRASLKARRQMAWGEDIPEELFRHFVLPIRVNNERLDDFRTLYYDTLRRRVEGLSLKEAALEINHWCHEKVTYVPSDSRTSSPLATMLTAEGRCGEESTFTVAAMRTVGIPARQVYTPRWAHTDSNHAWVEVWVDGKWQFMGACEPEPELNVGWFNQPATRAMLMHTRVYGDYHGPEDVIQRTECFTEINVVDTYAPTRKSVVKVVDVEGKAVADATVEFKIFNFGEFNSVVTLPTNEQGEVSLHMGMGDMMVWASKGGRFGFGKLSGENMTIALQYKEGDDIHFEEDITPPPTGELPVNLTEEQVAQNKERLAYEDSLRMAYTSTFMTREKLEGYSRSEQSLIVGAMGNWRDVKSFIDSAQGEERAKAVAILRSISRKDLHDTSLEVLQDALQTAPEGELTPEYTRYLLSPRIANEFLQPYRSQILEALTPEVGERPTAKAIAEWVKENIEVGEEYNPIALQATPAGVLRLRYADSASRNRFFVAACRSFGIASRMGGMGVPQYKFDGEWLDINLDGELVATTPKVGGLRMTYDKKVVPVIASPNYYSHYTVSRIEDGKCRTIRFDRGNSIDLGANADPDLFARQFNLEEGYYLLTTGNRMASGKILSYNKSFTIKEGKVADLKLHIRPANDDVGVIGSMDPERRYLPDGATQETSLLSTTGRGYFIVAVMGSGDEPTNHALRGLSSIAQVLNEWNRPVVILSPSAEDAAKFNRSMLGGVKAHYGIDVDGKVRSMLRVDTSPQAKVLPAIALCDSFGRIVYISEGYNTSLAEQLKSVIHKL